MVRSRLLVADVLALAAALLATSAAATGLFVPGLYRDVPFWAQQARGTDIATLFLAVPILLVGIVTARRGSAPGRTAVTAGLLYLVYNYAIFAFSVQINPLLAVYIATLGLAVWSVALYLTSGNVDESGFLVPRRTTAWVLIGVAAVFSLLWLSQIGSATLTGVAPPELQRAEIPTNPIYALDLGLFLPLCAVAAIGVLRRMRKAASFAVPMLIWLSLTSVGIVCAFVLAAVAGDEIALVPAILVSAIGITTGALGAVGLSAASGGSGAAATRAW